MNCQTEISASAISAGPSSAQPGLEKLLQADQIEHPLGDAPQRAEDQLPDEADDDDRQHDRQEVDGAEEHHAAHRARGQQRRQQQPDGVLHHHVDDKEDHVVTQRAPETRRPQLVGQQRHVVLQADEHLAAAAACREQAEAHRIQQRVDHEDGVDDGGRQQEDDDVKGERLAATFRGGLLHAVRLLTDAKRTGSPRPLRSAAGCCAKDCQSWVDHYCCGLYHLSRPSWISAAASSGVDVAVHDLRADAPQLVLQVRLAARENLVRVANRRLALAAPAHELCASGSASVISLSTG